MPQGLTVQIDDRTVQLLRQRAQLEGVTLEEEARRLLNHALESGWEAFWARADRIQESLMGRSFPDSAELIREDRNR